MGNRVRVVARFKDPGVDAQMREIVQAASGLLDDLEGHAGRKDNPHQVTTGQIGAETPTGAQSKVDAAKSELITALTTVKDSLSKRISELNTEITHVQTDLLNHCGEMGDYAWKTDDSGNLVLFFGVVKIAVFDTNGNLKIKGEMSQMQETEG